MSVYSSTSGVVLPAFLPTAPGLATQLGGANPVFIAFSMNVGSHLVDVSPLSTIGALCIAAAPANVDTRQTVQSHAGMGTVYDDRRRVRLLGLLSITSATLLLTFDPSWAHTYVGCRPKTTGLRFSKALSTSSSSEHSFFNLSTGKVSPERSKPKATTFSSSTMDRYTPRYNASKHRNGLPRNGAHLKTTAERAFTRSPRKAGSSFSAKPASGENW